MLRRFAALTLLILALALGACTAAPSPEAPPQPTAPPQAPTAAPASAQPATGARSFRIVSDQTTASYQVKEEFFNDAVRMLGKKLGLTDTIGKTNAVSGEFTVAPGNPPQLQAGKFEVDISTLKSDESRRDNRIRSNWLESARYPIATFVATAIQDFPANFAEGQPAGFKLAGDMTIHDTTRPLTFDVVATLQGDAMTGTATAKLLMTDFGVEPPSMAGLFKVGAEVLVRVEFTAAAVK